ncbi:MAG TPA: cupredoxin domain-containing protein [Anaerolineales bacterium]|nr:cupredoxin domain-containing protein [Anaerolineales bacterium]
MSVKKCCTLLTIIVALIGSMFLTACGGGGSELVTTIDVDMTDHKFTPNEFAVPAEVEITINLENSGKQPHEFRILVFGAKADESVDKDGNSTRYWSAIAQPGESKSLTFTAPSKPGSYVIKCTAPGHAEAGMVGTLQVK